MTGSVGIVIPLYNKGPYVERAVRSVLAQTHGDWRLVVVDDGSTDDGPQRVEALADPRITVSRYPNGGVSMARNRGVAELDTEWIAFLDADDEWHPDFLRRAASVIDEANQHLVAVGTGRYCDSCGGTPFQNCRQDPWFVTGYFDMCTTYDTAPLSSSSCVVNRPALLQAGGFPPGVWHGEDSDTWMRLAWLGPIAFVPETLATYHDKTPGNTLSAMPPHGWGFPVHPRTFRRWRGRIPAALMESSRRYVANEVLIHAGRLLHYGARAWALEMLVRNLIWARYAPAAYRWLLIRAVVGDRLAQAYGRWRRGTPCTLGSKSAVRIRCLDCHEGVDVFCTSR